MDLGTTLYRDLGAIDTTALRAAMAALPAEAWLENPLRQQKFFVHRQTRSILFLFSDDDRWPDIHVGHSPRFEAFQDAVMPIFSQAARRLGIGGRVMKAMLALMPPATRIDTHTDLHPVFASTRRLHVPLATNDRVDFRVSGQRIRLAADRLYEINNLRPHSVRNGGNADRVHLIFDLLALEERT